MQRWTKKAKALRISHLSFFNAHKLQLVNESINEILCAKPNLHQKKKRQINHATYEIKYTLRTPCSASSLPAAKVAPPARKEEWWNNPFFF